MRTRDIKTGRVNEGVEELLRIHDDGYRITATWLQGAPQTNNGEKVLWAEYKHCDDAYIGGRVADLLFKEN